jgi:uncharacterized protein YbbC (DUF1343 family)
MEAAAARKMPFVVLDRPDPLGGLRVEGTPVQKGFESFVSQYPIPYVYGATPGELARVLNEQNLLAGGAVCSLRVVPMKGWKRTMMFTQTGLPWVPTSPHIPEPDSPEYYVAMGILGELGAFSEGVGYTLPFKMFGAQWIDEQKLADVLNAKKTPGVLFRPVVFRPFYGHDANKDVHGVQIHIIDPITLPSLMAIQFQMLEAHHQLYPDRNVFGSDSTRIARFDKVAGTDRVRKAFQRRWKWDDARPVVESGVAEFRALLKKYWLYQP